MKHTIKVTNRDINTGSRHMACSCPVAKALRRTLNTAEVLVDREEALISGDIVELPKEVCRFIDSFDAGYTVHPFEFEIDL